ncbi:T-cell-interacting, activating receptor on myeloid cells protein 1 [Talpa occidentalis]|uniref:T-cell-interacting, activating receptor on myeloid cells protein 1 n=1 Tax=Talpa occidentalis TaxID=50954 RepID=UPI0018909C91|nr:T-cell-interacting, activating receptor on myeloid cells protein 1 [Talpa occidentalis]
MLPLFLTLLFTGLRMGQGDTGGHGPLPRPSLTAWPSAVVPEGGDVTLTCRAPIGDPGEFVLRRGGYTVVEVPPPDWTEGLAKFSLTGLKASQAGEYTCHYQTRKRPRETSPPSEALLLLVTGFYNKPSLQAHPRGEVTAGENVTLQCQWPRNMTELTHFVILKAGESTPPTQVSTSHERGTRFSLPKVTASDSGNYSCVSHMTRTPFRASLPSESVSIQVTGLRVGQGDTGGDGPLPRPSLTAWPSAVVPEGADVTLTCRAPIGGLGKFHLRRGGHTVVDVPPTDWTEGPAEFSLTGPKASRAGEYTCHYQRRERPRETSPPSEVLLLLVTGSYPKPSLQAHPSGEVTTGENVTLQCQWPRHVTELTHFVILKAGESAPPTQVSTSHERGTDFFLLKVTASDSGNYSCVSHQTRAPFWASCPSESVSIQVTGSSPTEEGNLPPLESTASSTSQMQNSSNLSDSTTGYQSTAKLTDTGEKSPNFFQGPTGFIVIAICTLLLVLLASFLIYKHTRCGAADKVTTSSRSWKEPEEMETNAVIPGQSRSPALDEGAQVSPAEEPCGVTYAELDTRALRERPSSQMNPSLETCVYSALKT